MVFAVPFCTTFRASWMLYVRLFVLNRPFLHVTEFRLSNLWLTLPWQTPRKWKSMPARSCSHIFSKTLYLCYFCWKICTDHFERSLCWSRLQSSSPWESLKRQNIYVTQQTKSLQLKRGSLRRWHTEQPLIHQTMGRAHEIHNTHNAQWHFSR